MKPEFTKPFDLGHAQAGAPYSCRDGREATVLKWDGRHPVYPINGVSGPDDYMTCWTVVGQYHAEQRSSPNDLVMLPLGMIDGKPVFVGDEFLWPVSGEPRKATADMAGGNWSLCAWPAPVKVYPETRMTDDEIHGAAPKLGMRPSDDTMAMSGILVSLRALANAALRHAIDAGQVVPKEETTALHHIQQGSVVLRECYDVAMRDLARAGFTDRAARDLAIAEAVRSACEHASYTIGGRDALDLAAIIATVK